MHFLKHLYCLKKIIPNKRNTQFKNTSFLLHFTNLEVKCHLVIVTLPSCSHVSSFVTGTKWALAFSQGCFLYVTYFKCKNFHSWNKRIKSDLQERFSLPALSLFGNINVLLPNPGTDYESCLPAKIYTQTFKNRTEVGLCKLYLKTSACFSKPYWTQAIKKLPKLTIFDKTGTTCLKYCFEKPNSSQLLLKTLSNFMLGFFWLPGCFRFFFNSNMFPFNTVVFFCVYNWWA